MPFIYIALLAVIQGAAELLPVSSSAHVIIAEKLLGLDPSSPEMTFFLVMLHTGTMFAVVFFFWKRWKALLSRGGQARRQFLVALAMATAATAVVGFPLKKIIEKILVHNGSAPEIELIFSNLLLISISLFVVGVLILISGSVSKRNAVAVETELSSTNSLIIGAVQGICLPFRGFSRSGATISTALLLRIPKAKAEDFSFALAVILTPAVIAREALRLLHPGRETSAHLAAAGLLTPGLVGMFLSFLSGLAALKLLSSLIEKGRWQYFGYYCVLVSLVALTLYLRS